MKKRLLNIFTKIIISLIVILSPIFLAQMLSNQEKRQEAISRVNSVEKVFDNYGYQIRGCMTEVFDIFEYGEAGALLKLKERYNIALLNMSDEIVSLRKDNEVLPFLSNYSKDQFSLFSIYLQQELKSDSAKQTYDQISEGIEMVRKQKECIRIEIEYLKEKITEEEVEDKMECILYPEHCGFRKKRQHTLDFASSSLVKIRF